MGLQRGKMNSLEELSTAVKGRRGVIIVGAGSSVSATANSQASSWLGLIRWSFTFLKQHSAKPADHWDLQEMMLESYVNENDVDGLIDVAGSIRRAVRELGDQAEANWLRSSVGLLDVTAESLPRSIGQLGLPILTTNYDSILENILGRQPVDWTQSNALQRVLAADIDANLIGHLHGHWENPESVIFSAADYDLLKGHAQTQALTQSIATLKSMIYIGFGAGLNDPTFERLLTWHRKTFKGTGVRHYRLCREPDLLALQAFHINDSIDVVSYGNEYEDLPAFLDALLPLEESALDLLSSDPVSTAHQALTEQMRAETIIGEIVGDSSSASIDDLVLPPILLPLPHDEFVQLHLSADEKLERLEPYQVAKDDGVVVIVGEEQSGLTTALQWILAEATRQNPERIPLLIDFRNCARDAKEPLRSALQNEAALIGVTQGRKSELPHFLAAIDNVSPNRKQLLERALPEIAQKKVGETVFLGCRNGEEAELVRLLDGAGVSARIMYVGRLSNSDVRRFVNLVDPGRSEVISTNVLDVLRKQSLPRTPFTIALLVSIFMQGKEIGANTSPTAVLDQYVSLLLGRGDMDEDSRYGFDSVQREAMLHDLAQLFLEKQKGSLPKSEVLARLESFFARYSWNEDALLVLESFRQRRVLRAEGNYIRFAQEAYLYLFLAKAALDQDSAELGLHKMGLLDDPLRYSPVIRHYAALSRKNGELLKRVRVLLEDWSVDVEEGTAYRITEETTAPTIDDDPQEQPPETRNSKQPKPTNDYDFEEVIRGSSADQNGVEIPFPLQTMGELPQFLQFSFTLDLVSTVLRDSDRVDDLILKRDLLRQVLKSWGRFSDFMTVDQETQESFALVADSIADAMSVPTAKRESFAELFRDTFPPYFTMSGIASSLASRRLSGVLNDLIDTPEFCVDIESAVPTAMLLAELRESSWVNRVQKVLAAHTKYWIVNNFLRTRFASIYVRKSLAPEPERQLSAYVSKLAAERYQFSSAISRKDWEEKQRQKLALRKLRNSGQATLE